MQSCTGSGNFNLLQKDRKKGENAILAILQKFIFYNFITHIFTDCALLTREYVKTMQHSCNERNGLHQPLYTKISFCDWVEAFRANLTN